LQFNSNVFQIPTSIYNSYYKSKKSTKSHCDKIIIGWLGSKSTSKNLINLLPVFKAFSNKNQSLEFHFCGFDKNLVYLFNDIKNLFFIDWTPQNEFVFLNSIDIGIMTLDDNLFNKGKCGFKLIQYMAMGKMTISTPLLSNLEINHDSENLFASSNSEWISQIDFLSNNIELINNVSKKILK
jgi:hypothetical protein